MTVSPDVPPLIDLTLLDVTSQDLTDQGLADATSKLPGWVPREGNTEVVLLEAQALIGAELAYAVNRLPDALLAALFARYGLTADPGTAPAASFTFATSSAADVQIPAGTRVRVAYSAGDYLDFLTDVDLLIAGGTPSGTVTGTGDARTAVVNGTPAGPAELVDAISAVDSVTLASEVTGGVDPEDTDAYLGRGVTLLHRLTSTLVLPEHFTEAALEDTAVTRAVTLDMFDPAAAGAAPGDNPGHVTVAVAGAGGTSLPAQTRTDLEADLEAKALAPLIIHVVDVDVTTVDVAVTITLAPGADGPTVQAAVTDAVNAYLDPDAWPFASTVYRNELLALVDRVTGVGRVVSVDTPAADVALTGVAPLARAGAVTVTLA